MIDQTRIIVKLMKLMNTKSNIFGFFRLEWPDFNITYPSQSIDWNAEKGYDANMPADVLPWRPYGAGLYYGLTLVLDVDMDEYYCSSTAGAGFKVRFMLRKSSFSFFSFYFVFS